MPAPAPSPAVDLRPLSTSELIDRGFSLYRQNFAGLLLLALLSQGGVLLMQVLMNIFHLTPTNDEVARDPAGMMAKLGFFFLIAVVVQVFQFCMAVIITTYVADIYLGRVPSVMTGVRRFGGRFFGTAWTWLLTRLFYLMTLIVPVVAETILIAWFTFQPPHGFGGFAVFLAAAAILVAGSLMPLLVVAMWLMVTVPLIALEGLAGWRACVRSTSLVRFDPGLGFFYWGETRLSLLLLPLFVIQIMISSLTSLPLIIAQTHEIIRHGAASAAANSSDAVLIGSQILTYLAAALILPLYSIAVTLFYYDVRIRKEGFDLEFMAGRLETTS